MSEAANIEAAGQIQNERQFGKQDQSQLLSYRHQCLDCILNASDSSKGGFQVNVDDAKVQLDALKEIAPTESIRKAVGDVIQNLQNLVPAHFAELSDVQKWVESTFTGTPDMDPTQVDSVVLSSHVAESSVKQSQVYVPTISRTHRTESPDSQNKRKRSRDVSKNEEAPKKKWKWFFWKD